MKLTTFAVVCVALGFSSANAELVVQKVKQASVERELDARLILPSGHSTSSGGGLHLPSFSGGLHLPGLGGGLHLPTLGAGESGGNSPSPGGGLHLPSLGGGLHLPGLNGGGSDSSPPSLGAGDSGGSASVSCSNYVIIETRGTAELQGPSFSFIQMNRKIMSQVPGRSIYNTKYLADISQISTLATIDIVRKVTSTLAQDPNMCFLLEGYSQGAAATVNAMRRLTGKNFDAVKGVFLVGDPCRRAGSPANASPHGGAILSGLESLICSIPPNWVEKTLDVCSGGDGICTFGLITGAHLFYGLDPATQRMGVDFGTTVLRGGTYVHH
ncbi:unnamed protein product [Sympodiomycopsis kandeliae]